MWRELLLALVLAASNFVIHALGMYALLPGLLRAFQPGRRMKLVRGLWIFLRFIAALMTLHFLDVSVWAEFYLLQRCFPDRETAYYFSLTSYTTVGYGDEVIPHSWRLMGGLEAMTGALLFGWSTASIVAFPFRFREARERGPASAGA